MTHVRQYITLQVEVEIGQLEATAAHHTTWDPDTINDPTNAPLEKFQSTSTPGTHSSCQTGHLGTTLEHTLSKPRVIRSGTPPADGRSLLALYCKPQK